MECFKCGIQDDRALLFDAISREGIVKICRRCSIVEDVPLIRVKTEEEIEEQKKNQELARKKGISAHYLRQPGKDDMALRRLVEDNFRKNLKEDSSLKETLIDNFHWAIMRARRAKHLTQEQLANAIKEPIIAIRTLEVGYVPEKSRELINKIETHLFVKLRKSDSKDAKTNLANLGSANLKISDLKEIGNSSIEHVEINDDLRFEDK